MSLSSTGDITTRPRFEHLLWLIKVVLDKVRVIHH